MTMIMGTVMIMIMIMGTTGTNDDLWVQELSLLDL